MSVEPEREKGNWKIVNFWITSNNLRGCVWKFFSAIAANDAFVVSSVTVLLVCFQLMFVPEHFGTERVEDFKLLGDHSSKKLTVETHHSSHGTVRDLCLSIWAIKTPFSFAVLPQMSHSKSFISSIRLCTLIMWSLRYAPKLKFMPQ